MRKASDDAGATFMILTMAASMAMVLSSSTLLTLWLSSRLAMGMRILRMGELLDDDKVERKENKKRKIRRWKK